MERRHFILLTTSIGSVVGGYIPTLWGSSALDLSSVFFAALGGVAGIWIGYRLG